MLQCPFSVYVLRIIVGGLLYLVVCHLFTLNARRGEGLLGVLNGIQQSLHHCILTISGCHLMNFEAQWRNLTVADLPAYLSLFHC